jgi:hypothetical protein
MSFNPSNSEEKTQNNKEPCISGQQLLVADKGDAWAKMVQSTCH